MSKSKKQKLYKMRGPTKKNKARKHLGTKKKSIKHLGGNNFAYTGKPIFSLPNPNLAYTNSSNMRTNINAESPEYPNTGPPPMSQNWLNSSTLRGGCGGGGTCGLLKGGADKHREECKCSTCKQQKGGNLVNYKLNTYTPIDISRQMKSLGAQPPFLGGKKIKKLKGGNQKGGAFLYQDIVNFGRQLQYGVGSTYNALNGYNSPVNPMPWQQPGLSNPSVFR